MPFAAGETVGPYQVIEQLGQGGMATVYKAYHPGLDRYVAIKVLHPDLKEDNTFIARFQREARLVAKLDHPNIVAVHDFAEHNGYPYLVMKFIEGETLKHRLLRGPLSSREIEDVVENVGSALAYAHQQGILHRDVKPSNVLLSRDGHLYLADFGLARIAQAVDSTLTSDAVIGTPQYISPEQAVGKKELDEGTDIYSFGVMLYEMVVGRVPFNADTPFAIIFDHIYTQLPMPRSVNPAVPESVEQVLVKALAKERADRYANVPEMVDAFKSAWESAGIPMQGTAIILPEQLATHLEKELKKTKAPPGAGKEPSAPAGSRAVENPLSEPGKTRVPASEAGKEKEYTLSGTRLQGKRTSPLRALWQKYPIWLFIAGGLLLSLCCAGAVLSFSFMDNFAEFRKSLGIGPAVETAAPVPATTEFTFCAGEQTWINRGYFPEQEIKHCWGRNHYITGMAYSGKTWSVIMTKEVPYTDQSYLTDTVFPAASVEEYWNRGFDITNVYYGEGEWIVVMSKGSDITHQRYLTGAAFPDEQVRQYWEQDYWISTMAFDNTNGWVVVMSQGPAITDQVYFLRPQFPADEIKGYWNDDFYITTVTYVNSVWAFAMSKGNIYSNQHYLVNADFPEDGISTDWDEDYFISGVAFGDPYWTVVMSK